MVTVDQPIQKGQNNLSMGSKPRSRGDNVNQILVWTIALLVPLLLAYSYNLFPADIMNLYGPIYLSAVLAIHIVRTLKQDSDQIWSATVLFPLQSMLFFTLGPLIYFLGEFETIERITQGIGYLYPRQILRVNLLSTLGISLILCGIYVARLIFQPSKEISIQPVALSLLSTAIIFLMIGLPLKYLLVLPAHWGLISIESYGFLNTGTRLIELGLALLAIHVTTQNSSLRGPFYILWILHLLLSVITFSKLELLIAIILPAFGLFLGNKRIRTLVFFSVFSAFCYVNLAPLTIFARSEILRVGYHINDAGYTNRLGIVSRYFLEGSDKTNSYDIESSQRWWSRLNYTSDQNAAMEFYDVGIKGKYFSEAWTILIPRIFWKNKPNLTRAGTDFYTLRTGRSGSSTGITIYGDLYWHYGWVGIWIIAPLIGIIFHILSQFNMNVIRRQDYIYFPVSGMIALLFLYGPMGTIITSIIGPIPIILVLILLAKIASNLTMSSKQIR